MIRKFVGGGFKIPCFYCKTFNIVYPQDPEYIHVSLGPQYSHLHLVIYPRQWYPRTHPPLLH